VSGYLNSLPSLSSVRWACQAREVLRPDFSSSTASSWNVHFSHDGRIRNRYWASLSCSCKLLTSCEVFCLIMKRAGFPGSSGWSHRVRHTEPYGVLQYAFAVFQAAPSCATSHGKSRSHPATPKSSAMQDVRYAPPGPTCRPVVAVRAIAERRERKPGQQRERKMAPSMSTARSARSETDGGRCRRGREESPPSGSARARAVARRRWGRRPPSLSKIPRHRAPRNDAPPPARARAAVGRWEGGGAP
jgi:hypothetical protein